MMTKLLKAEINCVFCNKLLRSNAGIAKLDHNRFVCNNHKVGRNYEDEEVVHYTKENDFSSFSFIHIKFFHKEKYKHICVESGFNYNRINSRDNDIIYLPKLFLPKLQRLYNKTNNFSLLDNEVNKFLILK